MPETKELIYQDLPVSFTPHPVTGNIPKLRNSEAIKKSIKNLILTNKFERFYRPNIGGDVLAQLFENFDSFTEHMLKKNIRLTIQNYEPRAEIIDIKINADHDKQELYIRVVFRAINSTEPTEVDVFVERTR